MKICPRCGRPFDAPMWRCPFCGQEPPNAGGFPSLACDLAVAGGGFRPEYFGELAALERGSFWFQSRNALIVWALMRYFPGLNRFLEIGCGTGFVLSEVHSAFPQAELTGSELLSAGLPHAQGRVPGAELVQMDARSISYEGHFDVVGAFDVLEHIVEDTLVLRQIHKALRPAGGLIATVPQHPWLWSQQDERACHARRYAAEDLRGKLEQCGFRVLMSTSFVSLLLPLMWLSRKIRNAAPEEHYDAHSELRIGRVANRMLGAVMTLEFAGIRAGLRFPVGGSRLVVAKKERDQA